MNVFDIVLIAISLIVITNVHRGSAENLCMDTLRTVFVNNVLGQENTVLSFQMAYKKLSTSTITNMFKPEEGDSPEVQNTKIQQHDFVYHYMMDLYDGRKVTAFYFGLESSEQWCGRVVAEYTNLNQHVNYNDLVNMVTTNPQDDTISNFVREINTCKNLSTDYLFHPDQHRSNPDFLFKILYEKWTEDIILDLINSYRQIGLGIIADSVERYTLGYFRYYERYVNPSVHADNNFKTIEVFCTY